MIEADYVIVGSGAAGALLANRLSRDPQTRVLLLEAGGPDANPLIRIPVAAGLLYHWRGINWGYETTAQPGLDGRAIGWPRGRVRGGSTAINGMMYIRGHRSDYDHWRQLGLAGWSYEDVLPRFRAFERNVGHDGPYHGHEGEWHTEKARGDHPLYGAWLEAARQAGFPANDDFNGAEQEGVGLYDFNIKDGRRVTAATAFLDSVRDRPNLRTLLQATATRLRFEGRTCTGVDVARGGETLSVRATREVILCAGAINTPLLLQASGIGAGATLQGLGLPVLVDRPDVGRNLQDHLGVYVQHRCLEPVTLYGLMRPDRALLAGAQAYLFGAGPGASVPLQAGGFVRTRAELDIPDIHITFVPGLSLEATQAGQREHGFLTNAYQLRPESRGEVRLRSADVRDKPLINPKYLSAERDRICLRDAVRLVRRIADESAMDRWRGPEISPGRDAQSDDEIDAWVRETANTIFHPVGTCRMGADDDAVLDASLRVRGVDRLRVADASAMPTIIGGNTCAPTMMIAETAAALIGASGADAAAPPAPTAFRTRAVEAHSPDR